MTDYLLTALIPMALFFVVLYGSKEAENQNGFMSREYTTIMKAVCCIYRDTGAYSGSLHEQATGCNGKFCLRVCDTIFFDVGLWHVFK